MAWTKIAKPTSSVWTNLNPMGKEQYDQGSIVYDDASTYYDGTVPMQWTNVSKPSSQVWTNVPKPS